MRRLPALTTLALLTGVATAWGSGLEIPETGVRSVSRGGAFSAKADDPSAAIHNPGGLIHADGFDVLYSHNLVWHFATFARAASAIPQPEVSFEIPDPTARVENETPFFGLGASLAASYGVGDWAFALSVYGPNSTGKVKYPTTGGQRYMLTELDALMLFVGGSAAWGTDTFGVGVTLQAASLPQMKYSLVTDGVTPPALEEDAPRSLSPYASRWDVEATLDVKDDFAPTAIVGLWWQPHPALEVGLSGRVMPVVFNAKGDFTLANVPGQSVFTEEQLTVPGKSAELDIPLPMTARLGLRYVHREGPEEVFDVEVDVVYEAWGLVDAYDADLEGRISLAGGADVQDVSIQKRWRDTFSVRLGGTYSVMPGLLALSAGGYFEQGASHPNYANLDFLTADRLGLGAGVELALLRDEGFELDFMVGYAHTFQDDITVDERYGKVLQQRPIAQCPDLCGGYTGIVANAGRFTSSYDQLSLGLNARF